MAAGGTAALGGAVFYVAYSATRMAAGWKLYGNNSVDTVMQAGMRYVAGNEAQAETLRQRNLEGLQNNQSVVGASKAQDLQHGKSAHDVSEAILGLREQVQTQQGAEAARTRAEIQRLIQVRGELATPSTPAPPVIAQSDPVLLPSGEVTGPQ
ncbi:MAG: hypothetical protein ACYCW6_20180 [Candidatus Xenobia bacterium]